MSAARKLTARQQEAYDAVVGYMRARGYPPNLRELGIMLDCCWSVARFHLLTLERKGLIQRGRGHRTLRVNRLPTQRPAEHSSVESILAT